MFFSSNFVVFTLVLFGGVLTRTHCSVLDRSESEPEQQLPSSISSSAVPVPDTIAEASEPTETTVSVVLSPPPFVPSSATTAVTASAPVVPPTNSATNNKAKANVTSVIIPKPKPTVNKVIQINNQTKSEKLPVPESKNITVISTRATTATVAQQVPSTSTVSVTDLQQLEKEKEKHRHDSKVMEIIQMGLTSLRHAGDRLKKFVSKIEAGIKSGALNETIESVKVKIEKGEIDLKKIIHAYKQKSTVGLEQLIKRISDDSHTLLDKLHGRVDATGVHIKEIPRETSDESAEAHHHHQHPHHQHHPHHQQQEQQQQQQQQHSHPKDANVTVVQEEAASETVSIYAPVPTETEFTA